MTGGTPRQVRGVAFRLVAGWYCVDIMRIGEVIRPLPVTPLAGMPPYLEGVVTFRGVIMPVVGLCERFGLPTRGPEPYTRMIILSMPGQRIVIGADEVSGVFTLTEEQLQPAVSLHDPRIAPFFVGVSPFRDGVVSVVNIDRLLTPEERAVVASVPGRGESASEKEPTCS